MSLISLLDTSICDYNLGNQIIMDAVEDITNEVFESDFIIKLQYLEKFNKLSLDYIKKSKFTIFSGTNSLNSNMFKYKQMGFTLLDSFRVENVLLLGVGWYQYESKPNLYTTALLRNILTSEALHSTRDSYTKDKLHSIGIRNVVNTCCPTTWRLTPEHCLKINNKKTPTVVCTVTDYKKESKLDEEFINILLDHYETCFVWLQGTGDFDYVKKLNINHSRVRFIPPKLRSFDDFLEESQADYIGTRLHAGIRAIQKGSRALILSVDNRAIEISKDTGLNVTDRTNHQTIKKFITSNVETKIKLPWEEIERWKKQFAKYS